MDKKIIETLQSIAGIENVLTDREDLICYSYDAINDSYLPDVVVRVHSGEEISEVLKFANEVQIPVVPRGAGTGFSGGALPLAGGICLLLAGMREIIHIDEENLRVLAEPGVITGDLHKAVEAKGLFYPPDPASLKFSTIGGNIAENAGGPRAVKYGVTRDYVMSLEVVLPEGEIITTGAGTVKSVVGYDLTRLIVGSEGTLGVMTKAMLKLLPKPETTKAMRVAFPHVHQATATVTKIISSKIIPVTLEFMDNACIRRVEDYLSVGLPTEAEALLIIEVDGRKEQVESEIQTIREVCKKEGAFKIEIAENEEDRDSLWQARRAVSPAIVKPNTVKLNEDIVVPRSKVPEIIKEIQRLADKYGIEIINFGHAGDGNIHVNILADKSDKSQLDRAPDLIREIFDATLKLGGSISGEHGIGITKAPYIKMELGDQGIEIMKRIKRAFDPNNILNPHKIFPQEK